MLPKSLTDEKWVAVTGGFISSKGRATNIFGEICTPDEKSRWYLAGKHQYSGILVAKAFEVENYDKLDGHKTDYIVRYKDKNRYNVHLENIYVGKWEEMGSENGINSHKNLSVLEDRLDGINFDDLTYKIIKDLPNHHIYENGEIYSTKLKRFTTFSLNNAENCNKYSSLVTLDKTYKVHRLVCVAFYPIEGKERYEDYKGLQVNHKDGNTLNNHKDNLEWETKEGNIQHAYDTGLNKKVQGVSQFVKNTDLSKGSFIKTFKSIAEASRSTNVPEHEIRTVSQGKSKGKHPFIWEFVDKDKAQEYSKKFSCM